MANEMNTNPQTQIRIDKLLQKGVGIVDMHFDMLMDLYEKRNRTGVLGADYWPELSAGGLGVLGVAIYIEDKYLPEMALRVALGQIARLYAEVDRDPRFAICKSYADIVAARAAGQIALLITLEGAEPLGNDINLVRVFYELGVRSIGLTHVRRTMAGDGGLFAPSGSSKQGLTAFGKDVVQACEELGILIDLAHLNPAGVEDVLALTKRPLIISHTNARRYYNIERNSADDQVRAVAQRGGVVGANAVLVSQNKAETTLDRYIDHIDHFVEVGHIDSVGIGFDFFEFIFRAMSPLAQAQLQAGMAPVIFVPDLTNHSHAPNVVAKLIERGYDDESIEKILYKNWMRVFAQILR
jgi:membrane dipeptidase